MRASHRGNNLGIIPFLQSESYKPVLHPTDVFKVPNI